LDGGTLTLSLTISFLYMRFFPSSLTPFGDKRDAFRFPPRGFEHFPGMRPLD
jgi:hypothetical protein